MLLFCNIFSCKLSVHHCSRELLNPCKKYGKGESPKRSSRLVQRRNHCHPTHVNHSKSLKFSLLVPAASTGRIPPPGPRGYAEEQHIKGHKAHWYYGYTRNCTKMHTLYQIAKILILFSVANRILPFLPGIQHQVSQEASPVKTNRFFFPL